jgi:vacuolar-type H+-ATPase subunit C/Vma6
MKISTEKAFDLLPHAVNMIEKLDMKGYILKNKELLNAKDKNAAKNIMDEKGFDFVMHILKNTGKVKPDVFEILAIVQEKTVEEIKATPFGETYKQLKELLQDTELLSFFKSAM